MIQVESQALDACVIGLYRAARETPAARFQDVALQQAGAVVGFDFAVWSRAALDGGRVRLYSAHELGLPAGAMDAWRAMEDRDVLGAAAFAQLGHTVMASPAAEFTKDPVIRRELIERFDLGHVLTTCLVDPFSALVSSVTFIRRAAAAPYAERDRAAVERLTPHLVEAHTACRLLQPAGDAVPAYPTGAAICDQEGLLEFASREFTELMRLEWPAWLGPRLPPEVLPLSGRTARLALDRVAFRAEPTGAGFRLHIRPRRPVDSLSAREAEIARLSALGRSNKQIAQALSLSPFTVRNHLDSVYRKLGVSKRSELAALAGELA